MLVKAIIIIYIMKNSLLKMHRISLILFFILGTFFSVYAQPETQTKGTVVDEEGIPIIGASIKVSDTTEGTITDFDGNFSVKAPNGAILNISYLGYVSQKVTIESGKIIRVILKQDTKQLDEVVVTALGIKREKKALGYSIGEVKGDELEKAKEPNLINALAGKVAGLVVSQTAGGPSGSSRVIVRGSTEMTGNNQPLYVIDGIPMDNSSFGNASTFGGYDLGDGISSINPDDIESMSVLKGPAASALYGSRASHGVILITTKKASRKKSFSVEFNNTTTFEKQLTKWENVQKIYGQGTEGSFNGSDDRHSSNKNWGPKVDPGMHIKYFDGVERPFVIVKDNIDGFFRAGYTVTNTLVVNSVKEETGIRISYSDMRNEDIVPNTKMSRNNLTLRANTSLAKVVDLDFKVNYIREDVKNRPALADHRANPARNLMSLATTFDQRWLRDNYKDAEGNYYDWNNRDVYNLNPYWIINEMKNNSEKDRIIASAQAKYNVNEKIKLQLSAGADKNIFDFLEFAPPSTPGYEIGYLQKRHFNNTMWNVEFLASYNDSKGKFAWGVNLGGNIYNTNNYTTNITAKNMQMRDVVALGSFLSQETEEFTYRKQINSVFATGNISYDNFIYVDATLRGDKSSTLPKANNSYLYPSVSGSLIFSELFEIDTKILSLGKLRASWAKVGSDTDPYRLALNYSLSTKSYENMGLGQINNSVIPNKDLKPTMTNSSEYGIDLKFLNNRIGFDATYYTQESVNQILNLNTTIASGYSSMLINAGKIENKGIELVLSTRPLQIGKFSWDLNFNFSKNSNKVIELTPEIKEFELESARWLDVKIAAVAGENYGAILGRDFKKSPNGDVIINASTGLPEVTDELKVLGNATWDWTGGITTSINYGNWMLSAIFDAKFGADLYSMSARSAYLTGKHKDTVEGRDGWNRSEEERLSAGLSEGNWTPTGGYLAQGVIEVVNADGSIGYEPNSRYVSPEKYWMHIGDKTPVPFIYDNSYVKVREITLTYQMPKKWIGKFAESLSCSFVARNPFIIYKNIPNIDPDSNYNNGSGMGLEYGSLPSRRSFGFNINAKF